MTATERIAWLKTCTASQRKAYYAEVASIGCLLCRAREVELHHLYGHGWPANRQHRPVIPLAPEFHRGRFGIHNGKQSFEAAYGTQEELLIKTEELLERGK
jgi:hypothetical protein